MITASISKDELGVTALEPANSISELSSDEKVKAFPPTVKIVIGVRLRSPKKPGTTVKKFDSIALYDDFFESQEQVRILSHELSHLYLHDLDKTKLSMLVSELGWRRNSKEDSLLRLNDPLLKPDSAQNPTEAMKLSIFLFLFALAFSSRPRESPLDQIGILQEIWNSKNARLALKKIPGHHKVEEDESYESLSTDEKVYIFSLAIFVSKKEKK